MRRLLGVLLVAAIMLVGAPTTAGHAGRTPLASAASLPAELFYNGTVEGDGATQTTYLPSPPNGTVWDLVSASIEITSSGSVSTEQNSYLYDSTCTQLDVAPAPSACSGIYGPNANTWANDYLLAGRSGTATGAGGYTSTEPKDVVDYIRWDQTIHLTYDLFVSFGAALSVGVSSSYQVVLQPEVGSYPSFAFYEWSPPVRPLSSSPTDVTVTGPAAGYVYRLEVAVAAIDLSSLPGPTRSAELLLEPSGEVLAAIDDWTVQKTGTTESACGGYSTAQTCPSDPVGTQVVWTSQIFVDANESVEARFVGVSGDGGEFAVVATEYPASDPPANSTGSGGATPGGGGGIAAAPLITAAEVAGAVAFGTIVVVSATAVASVRASRTPRRRSRRPAFR